MMKFIWSLLPLLTMFIVSCSVQENQIFTILVTEEKRHTLYDSTCTISEVGAAVNIGGDSTILYSNKVFLMVKNSVKSIITESGEGPGKFVVCSAPCISQDTLFILDAIGGKILAFHLKTNAFIRDYKSPILRNYESIYRFNGIFYGLKNYMRLALENSLTSSTPLLSSISVIGDSLLIQDLPFAVRDAGLTLVERLPASNPFKLIISDKNKPHIFYFGIGFSKLIWQYNIKSKTFQATKISLGQPDENTIKNAISVNEEFSIIQQDSKGKVKELIMSMEVPMFSSVNGDTLSIISKYFAKYDYIIKIYSVSQNRLLAEGKIPLQQNALSVEAVHILDGRHIALLEVSKNANIQYPYTLVTKKLTFN